MGVEATPRRENNVSILRAIYEAQCRFEDGSLVPVPAVSSAETAKVTQVPGLPAKAVYLSTRTLTALQDELSEAGRHDYAYEVFREGRIFGMRILRASPLDAEALPFPYIHIAGG